MSLYFVTGNIGKFAEMKDLIPEVEQLDIDLLEIQAIDSKIIIKEKINEALKKADVELIVEDTSLTFAALNGLPGPRIKWFLESLGVNGLVELCEKLGDNKAQAKTVIGYAKNNKVKFFEGVIDGKIVKPRGEGFGWDPIFEPDGFNKTFGEMTKEEKNSISHRFKAASRLANYLKSNG